MINFKDFLTVDYTPGMPEEISYAAMKRKRGRIGEEIEQADEALDFAQRRARARIMKKHKAKLAMGRRKASRRTANLDKIKKRARKQAINQMFTKLSKGVPRSELPAARKQEIEKRLEKLGPRIDKIARKLVPQVRKSELERRSGNK